MFLLIWFVIFFSFNFWLSNILFSIKLFFNLGASIFFIFKFSFVWLFFKSFSEFGFKGRFCESFFIELVPGGAEESRFCFVFVSSKAETASFSIFLLKFSVLTIQARFFWDCATNLLFKLFFGFFLFIFGLFSMIFDSALDLFQMLLVLSLTKPSVFACHLFFKSSFDFSLDKFGFFSTFLNSPLDLFKSSWIFSPGILLVFFVQVFFKLFFEFSWIKFIFFSTFFNCSWNLVLLVLKILKTELNSLSTQKISWLLTFNPQLLFISWMKSAKSHFFKKPSVKSFNCSSKIPKSTFFIIFSIELILIWILLR